PLPPHAPARRAAPSRVAAASATGRLIGMVRDSGRRMSRGQRRRLPQVWNEVPPGPACSRRRLQITASVRVCAVVPSLQTRQRPNTHLEGGLPMILRIDRLLIELPAPNNPSPHSASAVQGLLGGKFGE